MRRLIPAALVALLSVGLTLAAPQASRNSPSLRCTLTGKTITTCCCEQRDGKLYCPLAKKTIEKCCCQTAGGTKSSK